MIEMIASRTSNNYIGKDGKLLIKDFQDLQWFREKTLNKYCVVGRKTVETLPNLDNRKLIVLTRHNEVNHNQKSDILVCHTMKEVRKLPVKDFIVIGGSEIYRQYILFTGIIYLTTFYESRLGDRVFPPFDKNRFDLVENVEYSNKVIEIHARKYIDYKNLENYKYQYIK